MIRHYVDREVRRLILRRYRVIRQEQIRGRGILHGSYTREVASRHFTHAGAAKACRRFNAQEGTTP